MKKIILIFSLILSSCGDFFDDEQARRTVENYGFTNVELTGRRLFGCGRDDAYVVGFKAVNPNGKKVTGVVCAGIWFKAYTMRLD